MIIILIGVKMNKFEAETKKQYTYQNLLVTAKKKVGLLIDDSWYYSMHWKNDTWVEQAKRDLKKRLKENKEEKKLLKVAKYILNEIEDE